MPMDNWSEEETSSKRKEKEVGLHFLFSSLCQKFAFTNVWEKIILSGGIVFALLAGVCLPLIILLFADLLTIFMQYQLKKEAANNTEDVGYFQSLWANHMRFTFIQQENLDYDAKSLASLVEIYAIETFLLGTLVLTFTFIYACLLRYVARKQMKRLRICYLSSILSLSVDTTSSSHDLYLKFQRNLQRFGNSIGDNFGTMILSFSVFVTCIVISFSNHMILTAMLIIVFPVMAIIMFFAAVIYRYLLETEKNHYQIAENLARDVLVNIETVKAYEGVALEVKRYDKLLITSQSAGTNTTMFFDFIVGVLYVLLYTSYALTFWQGMTMALELKNRNETPDVLIVVNFCMQLSFVNFLKIPIFVSTSKNATVAYEEMIEVMRKAQEKNSLKKPSGHIPNEFIYRSVSLDSSTSGKTILNNVSSQILPRSFTCVVGGPKSGKSAFLKLLIKLATPKKGSVHFGKWNVDELNGIWLRNRIGYVQQRTTLFGDTIREAVKGSAKEASDTDIIEACRLVNVHSYVQSLQMGYDSFLTHDLPDEVKEKLAIARILVHNPDLLILDDCMNNINSFTQMAIISEYLNQKQSSVIAVTLNTDIMKFSDLIIHIADGKIEADSYTRLVEGKTKFRAIVSRTKAEKNVIDFEPGLPQMKRSQSFARETKHIGMGTDEMRAHLVSISRLSAQEKQELQFGKDSEANRYIKPKTEMKINCWRVLSLNRSEYPYLITAVIAATIMSFSIPAYASLFGESLGTVVLSTKEEIEENINFFPQMFLVAGIISGIARVVEGYMIAVSCSKLTKRLRKQTFEALLQKDIAFFDKEENKIKSLLYLLRHDTRVVPMAAGPELVLFIKVAGIIFISTMVSVYHSWQLGLLVLGLSPFLFYGLYYISRFQSSEAYEMKYLESNQFAKNILKNRETILILNMADHHIDQYRKLISSVSVPCMETIKVKSFLFAYSQSVPFFAYAACMLYGSILIQKNDITFTDFFKVMESLVLGTILVGQVLMIIPNRWPCLKSYTKILEIIPTELERARLSKKSKYESETWLAIGYVKLKHVSFSHPHFGLLPRLFDINIQINERQKVIGLTGLLNSGNSIPIKLILQFYKFTSGNIVIDDIDISGKYSLKALRRNIALVDGRNRFFRRSVARNIAYSAHNMREGLEAYVGMDDIVAVAKEADVHNFIITLPDGYSTIMTEEVCRKMTSGQVLRLSLAKALLRHPRLLLIENIGFEVDEDAQSLMETAIKKACFSRTVILSSNYVASLANIADCIYFFHDGYIKEFGRHQKLMEKQGMYYKLYEQQKEQLRILRDGATPFEEEL